ncbi:MAG TPA: hypothetical protein VII50_05780 [Acidothermaceae bacterium]
MAAIAMDRDGAERACASASLLASARTCVDAIDRVRRNRYAETVRRKDVALPTLKLVVAVVAHRLTTSRRTM